MFEKPQIRQMNSKCFGKKSLSDELFIIFPSKVQNRTVFSIIYMIRIRFFGPRELIQSFFRTAQYIDAVRRTHAALDVLLESRKDDYWNDVGDLDRFYPAHNIEQKNLERDTRGLGGDQQKLRKHLDKTIFSHKYGQLCRKAFAMKKNDSGPLKSRS